MSSPPTDSNTVGGVVDAGAKEGKRSDVLFQQILRRSSFYHAYVKPHVPFRNAKEFRKKRQKLIRPDVAEMVDFKDVISCAKRFQKSADHYVPVIKPVVSEMDLVAAINQQTYGCAISGRPECYIQDDYFMWQRDFAPDPSKGRSSERDLTDRPWPDFNYESSTALKGSKIFDDVTSQNVDGIAGQHRSLLLSSCVKQFIPKNINGCVTWSEDFITEPSTSSSSLKTACEPFRAVPTVLREMIREKLHILESYIVPLVEKGASTNEWFNGAKGPSDSSNLDFSGFGVDALHKDKGDNDQNSDVYGEGEIQDHDGDDRNTEHNEDTNDETSGDNTAADIMKDKQNDIDDIYNIDDNDDVVHDRVSENQNDDGDEDGMGVNDYDMRLEYDRYDSDREDQELDVTNLDTLEGAVVAHVMDDIISDSDNESNNDQNDDDDDIYNTDINDINYSSINKQSQINSQRDKEDVDNDDQDNLGLHVNDDTGDYYVPDDQEGCGDTYAIDNDVLTNNNSFNENTNPKIRIAKKLKVQLDPSEHSLPDGIFEMAARNILLGPSAEEHSFLQKQSLTEEQYEGETSPANLAGLVAEQYDMQVQSLECAVARHMEGVADGVIILVLNYLKPFADVLRVTQWEKEKKESVRIEEETKLEGSKGKRKKGDVRAEKSGILDPECPGTASSVTSIPERSGVKRKRDREEGTTEKEGKEEVENEGQENEKMSSRQDQNENENGDENESEGEDEGNDEFDDEENEEEEEEEENNEDIEKNNKKKKICPKFDISKVIEKFSSNPADYLASNWHSDAVMNAALKKPSELPLFNWEHVLYAVQDYADSMQKINSVDISMPGNIPDIRLTPHVIKRFQGRLLGLFGGVSPKTLQQKTPKTVAKKQPNFTVAGFLRKQKATMQTPVSAEKMAEQKEIDDYVDGISDEEEKEKYKRKEERRKRENEKYWKKRFRKLAPPADGKGKKRGLKFVSLKASIKSEQKLAALKELHVRSIGNELITTAIAAKNHAVERAAQLRMREEIAVLRNKTLMKMKGRQVRKSIRKARLMSEGGEMKSRTLLTNTRRR